MFLQPKNPQASVEKDYTPKINSSSSYESLFEKITLSWPSTLSNWSIKFSMFFINRYYIFLVDKDCYSSLTTLHFYFCFLSSLLWFSSYFTIRNPFFLCSVFCAVQKWTSISQFSFTFFAAIISPYVKSFVTAFLPLSVFSSVDIFRLFFFFLRPFSSQFDNYISNGELSNTNIIILILRTNC